ncbi:hypothetical protein BDB01DRAFT_787850 [Pilobolus umbonatus]|nr:hypothetical protein BDB01DRAFT_787850 [Pilobolus umbonatus]
MNESHSDEILSQLTEEDVFQESASQIIEEEEDVFLDDCELEPTGGSFRNLLAGPSANKAGLQHVDKDKINNIIYEASKGTSFFEHQKRHDEAISKRIDGLLEKYKLIKDKDLTHERIMVDTMIQSLEESRDLSQCICHIDMDAFYASVEELERPELKTKPMAVGDLSMLCTSNYEARKYGVRSAMPGFIALKLCPSLELVPLHPQKYKAASDIVRSVFMKYDPHFMPMSLDEAYLNLTEYLKQSELTPYQLVEQIRREIHEASQLTASAGIACNNMLAKICSDINKPNGQYYLPINRSSIMDFMKDLKLRSIPGVGRVTERVLEAVGIRTCADIYTHRALLSKLLTPITFQFLIKSYLGISSSDFNSDSIRKSISVERTFPAISHPVALNKKLEELCQLLEADLEKNQLVGRNIGIKLKLVSFEMRVRSKTVSSYIWKADDMYRIAEGLLKNELPVNIRLMGIRLSTLKPRGSEDEGVLKYFKKVNRNDSPPQESDHVQQETMEVTCPICQSQLQVDNDAFNRHVDECLNRTEVKSILDKNNSQSTTGRKKPYHKRPKRTKKGEPSLLDYYKKT